MKKITVVGSLNMDLVTEVRHLPVLGETVSALSYAEHSGGKGANQAVAAAKMGGDVSMIGAVGADAFGTAMTENLRKSGVHTDFVSVRPDIGSGKAMIAVSGGDNAIIISPGANDSLTPKDIENAEVLFRESAYLLLQLETPMDTVLAAAKTAKKHGCKVILNPAPAKELPDEIFSYVDILAPNETECAFYTGILPTDEKTTSDAMRILLDKGVSRAVITLGAKGVAYSDGEKVRFTKAQKVKAVDTTAAGDSFIGSLSAFLSGGDTFDRAIEKANAVSAAVVTRKGAQDSIPGIDTVREMFPSVDFLSH